jgi:F-type H+-transporting ATPase subunit epsilon
MKTFHLTIARIGERVFDGDAESVTLPGKEGVFTVLAQHEPYVAELKSGSVKIKAADGVTHQVEVPSGGIAEISHNQATVIL